MFSKEDMRLTGLWAMYAIFFVVIWLFFVPESRTNLPFFALLCPFYLLLAVSTCNRGVNEYLSKLKLDREGEKELQDKIENAIHLRLRELSEHLVGSDKNEVGDQLRLSTYFSKVLFQLRFLNLKENLDIKTQYGIELLAKDIMKEIVETQENSND